MAKLIYKDLSYRIIGAAMTVHRELGPGYLEPVYQKALAYEFSLQGVSFVEQYSLPVTYKGVEIGYYVADYLVEQKIVVEIKAASVLHARHRAQALNYLAAAQLRLAILINFGESSLKQQRIVR